MDELQPRTSRYLASIARWTLVGVVAVAMLGWLAPGTGPWAGLSAGLLCVFVVWLLSKMAAGDRTIGGHPIYLALAGLAGVLLWHLATSGLRKSHPDLSGELTVSMLFHVSLAAIAVLAARELLGPARGRWPALVCGGAMLLGSGVALLWALPSDAPPATAVRLLGLAGGFVWTTAFRMKPDTPLWRKLATMLLALTGLVAGIAFCLVNIEVLLVLAFLGGATDILTGVILPRHRARSLVGGGFLVAMGAVFVVWLGTDVWPLRVWSGSWTALGAGEQAAGMVYAADSGLEILPAVAGWAGTAWVVLGALGTLIYLLIRARKLARTEQAAVDSLASAAVLATAAVLAPGGLALPGVTLAAAVCWGMLAARATPDGRRWPGWLLLPAGAVVLLAMGVAGKPGLAQWAAMSLQDNRNFLHGPAGLLVGLLLAWLLGARRGWLGLIGIAIAIGLGALGEVVQGVVSHATKPIASKGRLPEMEDFWYHLVGCSAALIAYVLVLGARMGQWPQKPLDDMP